MIFDKDGTIIELYHYWSKMVYYRAQFICERLGIEESHVKGLGYAMGVDWDNQRLRPEGPVGLKRREIVMKEAVSYLEKIGYKNMEELCFNIFQEVDEFSLSRLHDFIRPINGSTELIRQLHAGGCKIAIATTDLTERASLAMRHLGLEEYIDLIVGTEMVKRPKPDPDQIELVLEVLKCKRECTVMVGDAATDVEMGINAHVRAAVGLLTGFGTAEEFSKITPYVVPDISGIKVVEKL